MSPDKKAAQARTSRLATLMQRWTRKTTKINKLHNEVAALGDDAKAKPKLFKKIKMWVEQIGGLREKELDIISEIDAIERKHSLMRKEKKLRMAKPTGPKPKFEDDPKPKRRWGFWEWLAFLMAMNMASQNKKGPKNG